MNLRFFYFIGSIVVLLPIVLANFVNHGDATRLPQRIKSQPPTAEAVYRQSPLPTPTFIAPGTLVATPAPMRVWATPPLPPIQWSDPPPCEAHPLIVADWRQRLVDDPATTRLFLQKAQNMSTGLRSVGDVEQLAQHLLAENSTEAQARLLQNKIAFWLNIMSGYLNRETEIEVRDLPDVKTVKALAELGEEELTAEIAVNVLSQAIQGVLTAQAITDPACAHLLVRQDGGDLQSIVWKRSGVTRTTYPILDELRKARSSPTELHISPDYRTVAIDTECMCEAGEGSVYLYDLSTKRLSPLGERMVTQIKPQNASGLPLIHTGGYSQVIGWHPDSKHLLLGGNGNGYLFWADLARNSYEQIEPDRQPTTYLSLGHDNVDLLPDGSGFVYVSYLRDDRNMELQGQLTRFDFATRIAHLLLTWPDKQARLFNPRVSPTGDRLVFLVEGRLSSLQLQWSLQLYNFKSQQLTELLASDHLGHIAPIWSPDGKSLAFSWGDVSTRGFYLLTNFDGWLGDIWVATPETNSIRQITHIQGAARRPVWSLDGNTLAFYLQHNQFGAIQLADSQRLWPITEEGGNSWGYGTLIYLP